MRSGRHLPAWKHNANFQQRTVTAVLATALSRHRGSQKGLLVQVSPVVCSCRPSAAAPKQGIVPGGDGVFCVMSVVEKMDSGECRFSRGSTAVIGGTPQCCRKGCLNGSCRSEWQIVALSLKIWSKKQAGQNL